MSELELFKAGAIQSIRLNAELCSELNAFARMEHIENKTDCLHRFFQKKVRGISPPVNAELALPTQTVFCPSKKALIKAVDCKNMRDCSFFASICVPVSKALTPDKWCEGLKEALK